MAKTKLGKMIKNAQSNMTKSNFNFINNKYLLYLVLLIVISDLLILGSFGEILYVVIYLLVGILTSFFSKNMLVILMVSMVVTNTIKYGSKIASKEGMKNKEDDEDEDEEEIIREKLSNLSDNDKQVLESLANGDTSDLNLSEEEESMFKKMISVMNKSEESEESETTTEGMKEGNKQSLKPKSLKSKKKDLKTTDPKPAEQGKKNLKTIEKETMDVRNKQKELMTSMKSLEPMLTEAKQFMENFKKK
jgi:uncharacterized membrane protein